MAGTRETEARAWDWTQQLHAFVELSLDVIFIKDSEGRYLVANEAAASTIGRRPDEVIGKTDFELFPEHVARKLRQIDQRVMSTRKSCTYDRSRLIENADRVTEIQKVPYLNPNGVVMGVIGIGRDVTTARRKEKDLLKEQNRLRSVVELAEDAIYVKDTRGTYLMVNPAFRRVYDLEDADPVGKRDVEVFGKGTGGLFRANDQRVMKTGEPVTFEWSGAFRGKRLTFQGTKVPYRLPNDVVAGVIGIARDVTDLRYMEERAKQAEVGSGVLRNFARELKEELKTLEETAARARGKARSGLEAELDEVRESIARSGELLERLVKSAEEMGGLPPTR